MLSTTNVFSKTFTTHLFQSFLGLLFLSAHLVIGEVQADLSNSATVPETYILIQWQVGVTATYTPTQLQQIINQYAHLEIKFKRKLAARNYYQFVIKELLTSERWQLLQQELINSNLIESITLDQTVDLP